MERGETSVNLRVCQLVFAYEVYMGVKCFTFVTLFVTHAPVNDRGQIEHRSLDTGVVKIMLNGVVDGNKPFPGAWHRKTSEFDNFCQRISNSQKLQGGNTDPLPHRAAAPPYGYGGTRGNGNGKAGLSITSPGRSRRRSRGYRSPHCTPCRPQ